VSYSKLPYSVGAVKATGIRVSYEGGRIVTRSVYAFEAPTAVDSNLAALKQANLSAELQVWDSYVLAVAKYDPSNLLIELRSI
jgi:hypothetical protein